MNPVLPRLIGKVVSSPLALAIIKSYAFDRPKGHLYDDNGTLYMGRWRIIDPDTWQSRLLFKLTGYTHIRLHWIKRRVHDRDLHNHPFPYRTFILAGWYTEEYRYGMSTGPYTPYGDATHVKGDTTTGAFGYFHRISRVPDDGVWTLFCMNGDSGKWGFDVDGRFVESREYFETYGVSDGKA